MSTPANTSGAAQNPFPPSGHAMVERALELIARDSDGAAMLHDLHQQGLRFESMDNDGPLGGVYRSDENAIFISAQLTLHETVLILLHEMRHAVQDKTFGVNARFLLPLPELMLLTRTIEADAYAYSATMTQRMFNRNIFAGRLIDDGFSAAPHSRLSRSFNFFARPRLARMTAAQLYAHITHTFHNDKSIYAIYDVTSIQIAHYLQDQPQILMQGLAPNSCALHHDFADVFSNNPRLPLFDGATVALADLFAQAKSFALANNQPVIKLPASPAADAHRPHCTWTRKT